MRRAAPFRRGASPPRPTRRSAAPRADALIRRLHRAPGDCPKMPVWRAGTALAKAVDMIANAASVTRSLRWPLHQASLDKTFGRVCPKAAGSSGPAPPVGIMRDNMRMTANFPLGSPAPSGFLDQGIFDEADHRRDDSPSDAAARQLPGQHTNIEAARATRRAAQGRYKPR